MRGVGFSEGQPFKVLGSPGEVGCPFSMTGFQLQLRRAGLR